MSEQELVDDGETNQESISETAPEQKEKVTFSEDQQAVIDKVGHQGRENVRQERQKTADLQRQLEEAQAQIPKETRPNVAATGDVYDEDYEQNRTQREAQIRAQAEFDTRQQVGVENAQQAQLVENQRKQTAFNDSLVKFNGSAVKFDIDQESLAVMDQTIASEGGLSPEVGEFVLGDDQGMLIYKHFAANPEDIRTVNSMAPMQAAIFLTDIKAKQSALFTKKTSGAPDPADRPEGGGVDAELGNNPYSKGTVYS